MFFESFVIEPTVAFQFQFLYLCIKIYLLIFGYFENKYDCGMHVGNL